VTRQEMLKARGLFQIKTWKGRPYVSKWPSPRGNKASNVQRAWQAHFSYVACISKSPDANTFDVANSLSRGTGWYYRDVIASAAVGKVFSTTPAFRIMIPTAKVHRTTSQALTSGVALTLTPNAMDWDTNVFWSATVNPTRLTIRSPGLYLITAHWTGNAVTGSFRDVLVYLNGATLINSNRIWPATANGSEPQVSFVYPFNANDYIEIKAQANVAGVTATLKEFSILGMTPEMVQ